MPKSDESNFSVFSCALSPLSGVVKKWRLRELKKAQGDATIMAQIFGVENAAAAQILLRSADY